MFGSHHHLQRASLALRAIEVFSISSQDQNASLARQGLSAASPHAACLCRRDYRVPRGGPRKRPVFGCVSSPALILCKNNNLLADDAVQCEPVSGLLTGKFTGNFAESAPRPRFLRPVNEQIQEFAAEFPTQTNREFLIAYQGKYSEEQGIFMLTCQRSTLPPALRHLKLRTEAPLLTGWFGHPVQTTPSGGANATFSVDLEKQESAAPTAAWSSSTSIRTASIACSTVSTISGSPWSRTTRSRASSTRPSLAALGVTVLFRHSGRGREAAEGRNPYPRNLRVRKGQ